MKKITVTSDYTLRQGNVVLDVQEEARIYFYVRQCSGTVRIQNNSGTDIVLTTELNDKINGADQYTLTSGNTIDLICVDDEDGNKWEGTAWAKASQLEEMTKVNLFSELILTTTIGFMQTNGTINPYDGCRYVSILVEAGDVFHIRTSHGHSAKMYVLINELGNVSSYYPSTSQNFVKTEEKVITILEKGTLYINGYDATIRALKNNGYKYSDTTINPIFGKKALFFGDSITAGEGSWADIGTIRVKNEMSGMNYGVGGATYWFDGSSNTSNCITKRIEDYYAINTDADIIILQGGVNDAFQSKTVGTPLGDSDFTTSLNGLTFAGAFEYAIRYATTNWAGKKIGFIANAKIPRLTTLGAYMDVAKQICEKYSVPILDLYNASGLCAGIQTINDTYYKIDAEYSTTHSGGTHPTKDGYAKYLNDKVEAWMKTL